MKKITLLFALLMACWSWQANAQFGCDSAIPITDGYTASGITTPGTGGAEDWNQNPTGTSISGFYWDDDVYMFVYTAGATTEEISMTIFSRNSWNGIGIFDECSGNAFSAELDAMGTTTANSTKTVSAVIEAGNTVYIAVGQWGTPNGLDFDVTDFSVTTITCPDPTELMAENINITTADLSWTAGDAETSWNIEVVPAGESPTGTGTATTDNPYTATDLTANTAYEFYVQADCGAGDLSDWVGPFMFTTDCDVIDVFPSMTDFTANPPTACWEEAGSGEVADGPATIGSSDWRGNEAYEDFYGQIVNTNAINLFNNSDREWLISPVYNLSNGGPYRLVVEVAVTNYNSSTEGDVMGSDDEVKLLSSTDGGATWSTLTTWNAANQPDLNGTQYIEDLTGITGNIQFAIWASDGTVNDLPDYDFHIGEFSIQDIPSCLSPSELTASNLTPTSADIAWTAGGDETLWNLEIVAAGEEPTGTPTVTGVTNPFIATDLDFIAESYHVYVQADCGAGDTSEWVGPLLLSAYCSSIPSSVDNEGITNFQLGDTDFVAGGEDVTYYSFTETPVDLQQGVEANVQITFETDYTYGTNIWIDFNDNFEFESSELVYSGESIDAVPTTLDASFVMPIDAALGLHRMRIATADSGQDTPDPCYNGTYGVTADFVVNVTEAPACLAPTDLSIANLFDTSVDLAWMPGGDETGWTIIYGEEGFDPATEGTTVSDDDGMAGETITGLTADTDYEFYVMSLCGEVPSELVGPFEFSTMSEIECGQTQISNNFENGLFIESGGQEVANDFIVNANTTNFSLDEITVNMLSMGGIDSVDILFFEDDNGMPGAEIETVTGVVPSSQDIIGTAFGFDVHEVDLELPTAIDFAGDGATDVRYWMQLVAYPTTEGAQVAWETTTVDPVGELLVYDNDDVEGTIWTAGTSDGVFTLSGECTFVTCPFPANLTLTNLTPTEATFAWNNISTATEFDWVVVYEGLDPASPLLSGTETDTEAIVSALESNTAYDFYLRSSCGTDEESAWTSISFTTPMGCGDTFVDSGGVDGDYANSAMETWTFAPESETEYVQLNFSFVDVELNYDFLRVYDGPDATYPELSESEDGVQTAGVYTSSTPGGSLTVTFSSDGIVTNPGWEAVVECVTCIPPTNLTVSNLTGTTATISWDDFVDAANYEYVLVYEGLDPSTPLFSGTTIETSVDLTDLLPVTGYDVYVRSDCGDEFSSYIMVSFETPCATYTPNYTEDFSTFVPECWTQATNGTPTTGPSGFGSSSWFHDEYLNLGSENNAAKVNLYSTGKQEWLISPVFDLSGADDYVAVFEAGMTDYANSNAPEGNGMGSDDQVLLLITTDGGLTWETIFTYNQAYYPSVTGTTENVDLSAYTGNAQFAFWATEGTMNDIEDYDFFINTFSIMSASNPICFEPTGVAISTITSEGATVTWDENPYATLGYDYIVVLEGEDPATATAAASGSATTNTVVITGLDPATSYDVYIMANCDVDSSSEWSAGNNFITECLPVTEFSEFFDDVATPNLPICWSSVTDNGASDFASVETTTGEAYSGANSVEMYNSSSAATSNIMLVSPNLSNLGAGTHWFRFFAMTDDESQDLEIGTLSDPNDGTTFTPIAPIDITGEWEEYIVDFTTYTGTDDYIAIRRLSSSTYTYVYIDNAIWEEKPSCVFPMNLVVNSTTTEGVNISWDEISNATGDYQWVVVLAGGDPNVAEDVVLSGTSATTEADIVSGLDSGTEYDFYVMADCGATDGMSDWSSAATFTTAYACGDMFYDTGGISGGYGSDENEIWTIYPSDATQYVQINFTSVDVEGAPYDIIRVYDGIDTSAPLLANGVETPGMYNSSVPGGPLTITFESDGIVEYSGWEALIECVTCIAPTDIEVAELFADGAHFTWTGPVNATGDYQWVIVAPGGDPTVPGDIILSGTSATTEVEIHDAALASNTDYVFYILSDCGTDAGLSTFSQGVPFTTACEPPTGLTATGTGPEEVTFTWDAVPTSLGYEFIIVEAGDPVTEENYVSIGAIGDPMTTSLTVEYLEEGICYDLYLRIVCDTNYYGEWDMVNVCTLGVKGEGKVDFSYYPNPVTGENGYTLNLKSAEDIQTVNVYNVLGQIVITEKPGTKVHDLDMSNLQIGTYIVKVTAGSGTETIKVIRE